MSVRRGKGGGRLPAAAGALGAICLAWAAAGLLGIIGPPDAGFVPVREAPEAAEPEVAAVAPEAGVEPARHPVTAAASVAAAAVLTPAGSAAAWPQEVATAPATPYPLEVGRYWVYRYEDPQSGAIAEVERAIVRRERRGERDLYHFADGTIVYEEGEKVYELGTDGGVNVIPLSSTGDRPFVYRSQGMQIAKRIGAADTAVVAGGRRYGDCVEVVTEFRSLEDRARPAISYSSFYARGVGLVGRERWPRGGGGGLAVELAEHGTRQL